MYVDSMFELFLSGKSFSLIFLPSVACVTFMLLTVKFLHTCILGVTIFMLFLG